MNVRWKLRMAAAQREVWTGAELRRLLAERAGLELSSASVSALLTKQPAQVKLSTLAALCTALDCTPNDFRGRHHPGRPKPKTGEVLSPGAQGGTRTIPATAVTALGVRGGLRRPCAAPRSAIDAAAATVGPSGRPPVRCADGCA